MNNTNTSNKITIILVDDHSLVRNGISALLEDDDNLLVIDEATNGKEAVEKVAAKLPDLAIIDVKMPVMNGIDAVARIVAAGYKTKTIVLSMHDSEEYVLKSIEAGAYGYLLKDTSKDNFLKAIYTVHSGEKYYSADISKIVVNKYLEKIGTPAKVKVKKEEEGVSLTRRERQVMEMALSGMSNKEIAETLNNSVRTVEAHRFNLMKKLKAKNVAELANKARMLNLI